MRKILLSLAALALVACSDNEQTAVSYNVIPLPQEINLQPQEAPFKLNSHTAIIYPEGNALLQRNAEFLSEYIRQSTGYQPAVNSFDDHKDSGNTIRLELDASVTHPEGYRLTTAADGIHICGQTEQGVFYGIQTLRKSIPATAQGATILLPAGEVNDAPRFDYRGMHLDVGRHFFPVEFIKKYIDLLALHNMNTFHWHLTEDQGWRIEIKKYPKLTEIGSMRQRTVIGKNTDEYDNTPYGGFYTQEQAKEIVEYARERYITIIPEVDLPGHMLAVLASYPEFGCTGGPYEVCPRWGIFEDVLCVGNEEAMQFLEDVMTEIIEIFPSQYIHIGGDESPRTRWKECPKCQARIKAEGLKNDHEHSAEDRLQSYCMARIEKFLNQHGRQIIGWDEILEGDVAPNATVMSWRGMEGGIQAAKLGHDVIMTPTSYVYFDYYQTKDLKDEPFAIGGYVPVEKVYSLEPVPNTLTPEEAKHIRGAQANLWTEYIATTEHVEYMVLPRMAALCEVQWTQPEKKDYKEFTQRLTHLLALYQREELNYAKHLFDITAEFSSQKNEDGNGAILVRMSTVDNAPIYYTLDGTTPTTQSTVYDGNEIAIKQSADFRALAIRPEGNSRVVSKDISFNKATFRPVQLTGAQPHKRYTYSGANMLTDGMTGDARHNSGTWLGFNEGDVEAVIDLGTVQEISHVSTHTLVSVGDWIMGCSDMQVYVSEDGKNFIPVNRKSEQTENSSINSKIKQQTFDFSPLQTRYVKVVLKQSVLPEGHAGAGSKAFLFIDELSVM